MRETSLPLRIERQSAERHTIEIQGPFRLFVFFFLSLALLALGVLAKDLTVFFLSFLTILLFFLLFEKRNFY